MEDVQDSYAQQPPSFSLTNEGAQELLNSLWGIGYRPSHSINEASQVQAMQAHIGDLRAVAFKKLGIEGKE